MAWICQLVRTLRRFEWRRPVFVQMTTHARILLEIEDESLPDGMRDLNRKCGKDFSVRHDQVGSLVHKHYRDRPLEGREGLLDAYAYVMLNPVKDGICRGHRTGGGAASPRRSE